LCAEFGSIAIYAFRNITNQLFLPVKAFDPDLKLLELKIHGKRMTESKRKSTEKKSGERSENWRGRTRKKGKGARQQTRRRTSKRTAKKLKMSKERGTW